MKKKLLFLSSFLLALFLGATMPNEARAAVTDLPELTTDAANPVVYTIKNTKCGKYATYAGETANMTLETTLTDGALFYFMGSEAEGMQTVKIHNMATDLLCAEPNSWTTEGRDWYIHTVRNDGLAISNNTSGSGTGSTWNDANSSGQQVAYWKADDDGSVWVIEAFGSDVDELVEAYKAAEGNTDIGAYAYDEATYQSLLAAQAAFKKNPNMTTYNDFHTAAEAITYVMPEAGKYYMIVNAGPFRNVQGIEKAMYSDGTNVKWATLNAKDRSQIWSVTPTDGGYTIQNYGDKKYPYPTGTTANDSKVFLMGTDNSVVTTLVPIALEEFNVNIGGRPAHAAGHNNGRGTSGNVVNWGGVAGSCSAWYLREVELPQGVVLEDATINYTVGGVVKKTVTGTFDTANPTLLDLAFVTFGTPVVDEDTKTVTVPCTYNLPFTASTSYENAVWYAVDMHCNDTGTADINDGTNRYTWTFVAENADIQLPKLPSTEVSSGYMPATRQWCFVGNVFDGFKIYNKAAGSSLTLRKAENGNTPVVMSATDDRNVFFLHETTAGIENSFAWKLADDNYYVNTQAVNQVKVLRGWTAADGGSSCRAFAIVTDIAPKAFYRIKGKANNYYLTTGTIGQRMPMIVDGTTAASIFYYDADRKLVNYASGLMPNVTHSTGAVGAGNVWTVKSSSGDTYTLQANPTPGAGTWLYNHAAGQGNDCANRNSRTAGDNTLWYIEPVTALPVTITAAGYATIYAPVALTVPTDVTAYGSAVDGDRLVLTEIAGGVIPANTAVVLAGAAGTYNLTIGGEAGEVTTDLTGVIATAAAPANAYTLQAPAGEATGFYPYTGTNVNGFKAYLETAAGIKGFAFDLGTATGIEEVEAVAPKEVVIYDLAGRRVQKAVKGLYIINGKKVIVK